MLACRLTQAASCKYRTSPLMTAVTHKVTMRISSRYPYRSVVTADKWDKYYKLRKTRYCFLMLAANWRQNCSAHAIKHQETKTTTFESGQNSCRFRVLVFLKDSTYILNNQTAAPVVQLGILTKRLRNAIAEVQYRLCVDGYSLHSSCLIFLSLFVWKSRDYWRNNKASIRQQTETWRTTLLSFMGWNSRHV